MQSDSSTDNAVRSIVVMGDGSVVLGGDTGGAWASTPIGSRDLAAAKVDSDGQEVWRWQVSVTKTRRKHDVRATLRVLRRRLLHAKMMTRIATQEQNFQCTSKRRICMWNKDVVPDGKFQDQSNQP